MAIVVGKPKLDGTLLAVPIQANDAHPYLKSGTFRARYSGVDLSRLDPSLLVIPAIGGIITTAYAVGAEIEVQAVDEAFATAADDMAEVWRSFYPGFRTDGFRLIGDRVKHAPTERAGDLMLYSGGVDALGSLLANIETTKAIFTIWGADVPVNNDVLWNQLEETIGRASAVKPLQRLSARTNIRRFADGTRLMREFVGDGIGGSWWMRAQHGTTLLSMAALGALAGGFDRVLIASTHSHEFTEPWGSSPKTDSMLRFADVAVHHDSYDLPRQRKISDLIAPHLREGNAAELVVCYKTGRGGKWINCGHCEKCMRTASGLLSVGIDHRTVGIPVSIDDLEVWRRKLSAGARRVDANEFFMWTDIQRRMDKARIPQAPEQFRNYLGWLADFDFAKVKKPTRHMDVRRAG